MGFIRQGMSKTGKVESILKVKPGMTKYAAGSSKDSFIIKEPLVKDLLEKVKKES